MRHSLISLVILSMIPIWGVAQDTIPSSGKEKKKDYILEPVHRNVIKFNPTPMLIWGSVKNCTFSYERLVKKNQSIMIQVGYLEFPSLFKDTIINLVAINDRQKWGMNIALEYRFYPSKRNRRPAPDGLYIAPYLSYYGFHFKNGLDVLYTSLDQKAEVRGDFNIVNAGLALGYQFIFWKRVSLDLLLFGPSLSFYSASLKFEGEIDQSQIEDIDQEMIDKLKARFPLISTLFSGETLSKTGYKLTTSPGFRWSVSIGFHF